MVIMKGLTTQLKWSSIESNQRGERKRERERQVLVQEEEKN